MELEQRLASVLGEFARTLATDFPIQAILDHLVVRIVDVLPIDGAGVTLITPGSYPEYIAASDESAMRYEQLQNDLGEGPCIEAYESGQPVGVPDLNLDDKYGRFSSRALDEGLEAVFTFPLRQGDQQLGALDLYRTSPGPLDARSMVAAQTLADVATAYLLNAQIRTELRDSSERARVISLHDALTGLPNRELLIQRLDHAVLRCRRSEKMVAILFVDLDKFKAVNDTYGHHVGDELLVAVGERLTLLLRPGDTSARLAGDEFAILCEDLDDASQVNVIAERLDAALGEPFTLSVAEVRVAASVGIAFAGQGEDVSEQILQDADAAMYQAKRKGGGRHAIIDLREQLGAEHRADLITELSGALSRDEFRIEYQPIVSTADEKVVGVEALLRWQHPTHGAVDPKTTVSLAEQSGLITEIGRWVMEQVCRDRQTWPVDGGIGISINVSPQQLMAADFAATVSSVLADTHTDPKTLTLEVTENLFLLDNQRSLVVLNELKRLGVMLALDDFGVGNSSLSYLKRFPVDIVKIDRVYIADLERDAASRLIVNAIVGLAHGLRMTVAAEGVETAEQLLEAKAIGCDVYQGFYFARPSPADDIHALLAGGREEPANELLLR